MHCMFPELEAKIAVRGIKKRAIASRLGISERCFYNRLKGKTPFTYPEVQILQQEFFPDMTKESLMRQSEESEAHQNAG